MIWNTRSRCLQRSGSHVAPGPFAALAAHQRELILRPSRSQPDVSIDCPSSVLDPSRRSAFVLLETVAYKAGATSRSIVHRYSIDDEKNVGFSRSVQVLRVGLGHIAPGADMPVGGACQPSTGAPQARETAGV